MRRLGAKLPRGWRAVGWIGVAIGIVAALVALPPFEVRNPVVPVVVGLFALTIGIGSWIRGERRIGAYAVATGFSGLVIGYLATVSSIGNLEAVVVWGALLSATLVSATPLVFASLGGLFSERSGVVNIGLEGMMLMGAFFSVWGADKTGHWTLGVLIGVAAGAATGLLHAFFSVTLRADQIVGGTAINFLALGITGYLFIRIYGERGTPSEGLSTVPDTSLDFLYDIPPDRLGGFLGDAFTNTDYLIWTALAMVFVTWVAVFKTPAGLRLRSVGEHPRAADTVGINVYLTRYAAVTLSGALAGAGGVYLALGFVNSFEPNMTAGRGFIALAALIFGSWRPLGALVACLLFGFSSALATSLQEYSLSVSTLFEALPYVLTLVAVAGVIGRSIPPAAIGRPYVKQ
ncbi:MAG TPA: ABC transporter permease [Gaiellaceae bacterium]|jgi:simple sugar transport system permease protein|nr:ABC transporter permease [Gaiellaceae bacterium]